MTNASISKSFAVLSFAVLSVLLSVGVFATTVHAQEADLGYGDFYGDNLGYGDVSGDNLGYGDFTGNNLGYGDVSGDNLGYGDVSGDNLGYGDTYGTDVTGTDVTGTDVTGTDVYGTDMTYENGVGYSYSPSFSAPTSFGGSSYYPSKPISFGTPTYYPPTYIPPTYVPPTTHTTVTTPTTVTNTNTNVNNNNNNININNNAATVIPVQAAPVQYQVQYVQPAPVYYQQPSCTITISNYSGNAYGPYGYNQLATLTWSSQNTTSGYISPNVGNVSGWGSMQVYPTNGQVYTMTVYGQGGTATCSTQPFYMNNYVAPIVNNPAPYVSLSQIPYTGFDFGTLGNSIYWLSLVVFAGAAAYLVLYFNGGALAVIGGNRSRRAAVAMPKITVTRAPAPVAAKVEAPVISPIQFSTKKIPSDTMHVTHSKAGEMPRIHIARE